MRKFFLLAFLMGILATVSPAQLRKNLAELRPNAQVFDTGKFSLNKLFSPEHFNLSHSYELSAGSYGGSGLTTGLYTASLNWNFGQKLDANVDVSALHTPFGKSSLAQQLMGDQQVKMYVRHAELNYRPTKNLTLHMSFHQNPLGYYGMQSDYDRYGAYGNRYGVYGNAPFSGGNRLSFRVGSGFDRNFWQPSVN